MADPANMTTVEIIAEALVEPLSVLSNPNSPDGEITAALRRRDLIVELGNRAFTKPMLPLANIG